MAPQGLDPVEVFESLPEKMQKCFKTGRDWGARGRPATANGSVNTVPRDMR